MEWSNNMKLLAREIFRTSVFARDDYKCVFCDKDAIDAHHILDRKLWSDGGYYLDNGISVCEMYHWQCERCEISVEDARLAGRITTVCLPPQLDATKQYDKWGKELV